MVIDSFLLLSGTLYAGNYVLTFLRLIVIASVVSGKREIVSLEINIPSFVQSLLGIEPSLKTFRATIGPNKKWSNDLSLAVSANNQINSKGDGFNKRTSADQNLWKMNVIGVSDAAAALQEMIQPYAGFTPQYIMDTIQSLLRRSALISKPRVEIGPGSFKTEIVKYPPNFFAKKLKFLVELQKKKEEQDRKEKEKQND